MSDHIYYYGRCCCPGSPGPTGAQGPLAPRGEPRPCGPHRVPGPQGPAGITRPAGPLLGRRPVWKPGPAGRARAHRPHWGTRPCWSYGATGAPGLRTPGPTGATGTVPADSAASFFNYQAQFTPGQSVDLFPGNGPPRGPSPRRAARLSPWQRAGTWSVARSPPPWRNRAISK